jgi:hypothetical protein
MTDTDGEDGRGTDAEESDGTDRERSDSGGNPADGRGNDQGNREPTRSGRRVIGAVFLGSVLLAGGFGYFIGSIGPRALGPIGVFGVRIFEPTPVGMALYGMTVTGLVLGVLFAGARFALRRESESERPSGGR